MSIVHDFSPPARGVIVAGACSLVIGLLKLAAPILEPILLAVFIAIVSTPALRWMIRHKVPKWGALVLIAFVLLDIGSLLALITTGALEGFRESFPTYQERFLALSQQLGGLAEGVGIEGSTAAIPDLMDPANVSTGVRMLLSSASELFAEGFIVILFVVFILLEAPAIEAKLKVAYRLSDEGSARLTRVLDAVNSYMQVKSVMSLLMATGAWLLLWLLGIDFAALWAILSFFLHFIPVIGGIVMMIPPVLMALVQTDLPTTLMVAGGYLALHVVIGDVIEPRAMGKSLGISVLTLLFALLFWDWLFGIVGIFLAVPLTTALVIAFDASPHTRPLAILLGSNPEEEH